MRDYFDCDDSTGHLTKKGFVEMIHTQTAARYVRVRVTVRVTVHKG